jgi:hypothetical protein
MAPGSGLSELGLVLHRLYGTVRNVPGLVAQVPALGLRAPVASVALSVLLKGAGQGGEDVTCMVAGHHVAAGPEVWSSVPGTGEGWRPPAGRP